MSNLKELLKTGVFGMTCYGDEFVVVNDLLVYKSGEWNSVNEIVNSDNYVTKLLSGCRSFEMLEDEAGEVIYRCEKKDGEKKSKAELVEELDKLLNDIKKDAKAKGLSDKEAKAVTDALLAAASIAALGEVFGFDKN